VSGDAKYSIDLVRRNRSRINDTW